MKEKVVGIDLGTGSLGVLLRNLELGNNIIDQLEWFSVTTFNAGTGMSQTGEYSLASDRRSHVQSRRLKEHSRWKRYTEQSPHYLPLPIRLAHLPAPSVVPFVRQ